MPRYNHAFTIAFEVLSEKEDGSDVTNEMFAGALRRRIADLNRNDEWGEAVGAPFDTFDEEEE